MIEIKNLRKYFNNQPVLRDVNLNVEDGESLTIIGRSGCGKSVLLKHILGLIRPDGGIIRVDGEDVTKLRGKRLAPIRRKFGILFQSSALFDSMTVMENIALPLKINTDLSDREIGIRVNEALEIIGLPEIGELKPSELSGGMKKRVGLARAIVYKPRYILYDEPTTGLDPIMSGNIDNLIVHLNEKMSITSIVVTHDMISAYAVSDRIVMLHYGKIVFSGTPDEIKTTSHPLVKQFVEGAVDGPIKPIHTDHFK